MNRYVVYLFICFFLHSCIKDDLVEIPDIYFGVSSADINGQLWEGKVRSSYAYMEHNYINLSLEDFENGFLINNLYVRKLKFMDSNVQMLNPNVNINCDDRCASFSTTLGGGDVAGDFYNIYDDDFADWVIIDSINNESLEFWGRFQVSFVRDIGFPKLDEFVDTLYFTNGVFHGRVLE